MHLREATAADTEFIIRLIGDLYRDYGFEICLEDAEADLADIAKHFEPGSFMVLCDDNDTVRATVALTADSERPDVAWMKRLYLDATLQGEGHADRLLEWALGRACAIGCTRVELWSDTLFERAHRFYTKHGFRHDGVIRHMTDSHEPYDELLFYKEIDQ
ncbi:MAG: GNAT family N-acetyltransferase [Candidatus Hydrogenedentota bacterium]